VATIRSLLRDRVTLQVRSVDRIFLHGYVPRLMSEGMVVRFLLDRGFPIPSPSLLGDIGRRYVAAVERFAVEQDIPVVRFARRESKEERVRPCLEAAVREAASASSRWGSRRRRRPLGAAGGRAARMGIRISASAARACSSTTTTSTFATASGGRRSSRPAPTRRFRSGSA
jgi:hypothetical protein